MANVGFENKIRRDCEYVLNARFYVGIAVRSDPSAKRQSIPENSCIEPEFSDGTLNMNLFIAQRHDDGDLKEVAVHGQVHLAALEFHQALGDVQAQAAAFGVAGGVAADEPLQQVLGIHIQFIPGDVLDRLGGMGIEGPEPWEPPSPQ